jgi:hypothetical protein
MTNYEPKPRRLRPRPLYERLDADLTLASETFDGSCVLKASSGESSLSWPCPIFLRQGVDNACSEQLAAILGRLRRELGVSTYRSHDDSSTPDSRSLSAGIEIVPVYVNEYFQPATFQHAEQIELQFFRGMSESSSRNSGNLSRLTKQYWVPQMPCDISSVDQLSRRVEMLRQSSDQQGVLVGAAIAACSVYDDIRYVIDAGFDYVMLLTHITGGLLTSQSLELHPVDSAIASATRAIQDSGRKGFSLLITTPPTRPSQLVEWFSAGVRAIGVDATLQQARPSSTSHAGDGFGSFMGEYGRQSATGLEWIYNATEEFIDELIAECRFVGLESLQQLYPF